MIPALLSFGRVWFTLSSVVVQDVPQFGAHLQRSLAPAAVLVLAVLSAATAEAADDVISTFCEESTVVLDADHTASRLGRCGDQYGEDLLWHLDRIDQISPDLDGHFDRHNAGAGVTVYVMDTGVMATHDEFESATSSRVIGGYDATKSLRSATRSAAARTRHSIPVTATTTSSWRHHTERAWPRSSPERTSGSHPVPASSASG